MEDITIFLRVRKSEYQKRSDRAHEQEKKARELLEDEPDRRVYFQKFRSCFAAAEGKNGSDMINQDLFKYVQNGNRVEVIGNIFDNPELVN